MELLKDFSAYEPFNKFCMEHKDCCPAKEEKDKTNDQTPMCHWCRIAYHHGFERYKKEVRKRLE